MGQCTEPHSLWFEHFDIGEYMCTGSSQADLTMSFVRQGIPVWSHMYDLPRF